MSMSQIILVGYLGIEPELKYTKNQTPVLNLSIGVSELPRDNSKAKAKTHWHKCRRWGKIAESNKAQLSKGDKVFIKGILVYDQWEDKNGYKHKVAVIEIEQLEAMKYENITIDMGSHS